MAEPTQTPVMTPGRLTHEQVDHILGEITSALATSPSPGGRLSLEHVVDGAARALVPLLLAHLPLELERVRGRAPGANGLAGDERIEILRQVIARLTFCWSDVAARLTARLGTILSTASDAEATRRLKDRVEGYFRETLPPNVLGGGASTGPREELAERVAEATVRLLTGEAVQDLRHEISAGVRDAVAAPGAGADRLAERVAHYVSEELGPTPRAEAPEAFRAMLHEEIQASLAAHPAAPGTAPEFSAEQLAELISQRLGTPAAPPVAPDQVAQALLQPLSEAMQSTIKGLPERKMSPEELKRLSNHLVAAMGGWVTTMMFGQPKRGVRTRRAASRPRKSASPKAKKKKGTAAKALKKLLAKPRKAAPKAKKKAAPKPQAKKASPKPKKKAVKAKASKVPPKPKKRAPVKAKKPAGKKKGIKKKGMEKGKKRQTRPFSSGIGAPR